MARTFITAAASAACAASLLADAPADWQPLIASGDMMFTTDLPQPVGGIAPGLYPAVGNGFIAVEMWANNWPWRASGSVHMAGVFNGINYTTPSHRAQLPTLSHFAVAPETGGSYTMLGSAIDYRIATYFNRTLINTPSCANTILEQRLYAHRANSSVLVVELAAWAASGGAWAGCTVAVTWDIDASYTPDVVLARVDGNASYPSYWNGSTLLAEEAGLPLRQIGIAFDAWVAVASSTGSITFPAAPGANSSSTASVLYATGVYHSDLDAGVGGALTAAVGEWLMLRSTSIDDLRASHAAAWAQLWSSGIELTGNGSLAATVNGSLYDILISMRDDWPYSTSPGGLMAGGYCGHSFWDGETWIFPNLVVLFPAIAHGMTVYRSNRLAASQQRAINYGYNGAFWAWESAFTGLDAAPWRQADYSEHHISGDIPMAMRKFFSATGDKSWLSSIAWPVLNATCAFWECRMTRTDSAGGAPPAGYGPACSPKDGVGNWTVLNVIPPDEAAGVVNNSVYTNAIAASTLQWCVDAADVLGLPVPALWAEMASAPYLPVSSTLDPSGTVHEEYSNWDGHAVNQADVALLQYPLGLSFPADLALRDLDYWTNHTNWGSFFTGDSAYSVSYLGLGDRSAADSQFSIAFQHMEPHFNVWEEVTSGSGTQHFITGAGGYLQSFVFGYSGMRINRVGVLSFTSLQPLLPPLGVTAVKLRGLTLLDTAFDFAYNSTTICVSLQPSSMGGASLQLRFPNGGQPVSITTTQTCVAVQPVEVAGVGYP